jgi:2-polyprenyl-3-methyl-5-hydroxy-6-metoxy-1,4-benzoquinol methylase
MKRFLEPEILDSLPPSDPRALHSRRDLEKINGLMGNHRTMARALKRHFRFFSKDQLHIVDLGGGDGSFSARVLARLAGTEKQGTLTIVDRNPSLATGVQETCKRAGWDVHLEKGDVFDILEKSSLASPDAIIANLFLHHFEAKELSRLFKLIQGKTRLFVATEPRRSFFSLLSGYCLGLIGCNDVTRHDAIVSIRAGFADHDLSRLWNGRAGWHLTEAPAGPFTHLFQAGMKGQ